MTGYNGKVYCGGKFSAEFLKELSSKNLIMQHKSYFTTSLGNLYELESFLYKVDEKFVSDVTFINESTIKINTWDLYNSYRHGMVYFFINNIQDYVRKEITSQFLLHSSKEDEIIERMKAITATMLLTKQASFELMSDTNILITKKNYKISNVLLNGKEGNQFLGALIQLFNPEELKYILANYTDLIGLKKITGNKKWEIFYDTYISNEMQRQLVYNTIGDLIKIMDPNIKFGLENNYVLNRLKVNSVIPGEKVSLNKFIIENGEIKFKEDLTKKILELSYGFEELDK